MDDPRGHDGLLDALAAIDPTTCSYEEWCEAGMALHESGFPCSEWERWSRRDPARFHEGECERKWAGFGSAAERVTSGTIVAMARERGWCPRGGADEAIGWEDEAIASSPGWADDLPVEPPGEAGDIEPEEAARQLSDYLAALFDDDDVVGYVTESWERDGRHLPTKGCWDRTAGQLRRELDEGGSIPKAVGDWDPEAGAWIRFNPLDGRGCGNANVAEYRYALVESDTMEPERQRGMVAEMNLPCAAVVYSGGKSVHAIVRIDAGRDYDLYRKRVERLYSYCRKHGLEPDAQNKNPSRLSRMPGVTRGGHVQRLLSTNTGARTWDEWEDWVAESEDDLPDTVSLADKIDDPDPLSAPLIGTEERGILRHGHKMLIAGPSKAGKSMLLMELAVAIARGGEWLGYPCDAGRVLYVNLEIDPASCVHRFCEVAKARGCGTEWARNIDLWNLRGHAVPMDQLTPRLVHRAKSRDYAAVIIDPIYKVITGDENSASEMAAFCNQFDRICAQLHTSVIYCHHHSKGAQGAKRSMDRASGSGVFARDPDAMLDVAPLEVPSDRRDELGDATAWRVSATLREFATPEPLDVIFRYPLHVADASGELGRWKVEGEDPHAKDRDRRREAQAEAAMADQAEKVSLIREAMRLCAEDGVKPTRKNVLDRMGEYKGDPVRTRQMSDWTNPSRSKWTPFSVEEDEDGLSVIVDNKAGT